MESQSVSAQRLRAAATMTAFIGRRREIEEALSRLEASRLVTITGPGGVGKTRLALEIAQLSAPTLPDGSRFVDLTELQEAARVADAVASGLDVQDQSHRAAVERLVEHLAAQRLLLVLDNCEHVLDGAARLVEQLLAACPELRILATSREPLAVSGESVQALEPMPVPRLPVDDAAAGPDAAQLDELRSYDAVRLLTERARETVGEFRVDARNAEQVIDLCARLDGIPLAIELAATRLRSLSLGQILERLDHRFDLLRRGDRRAVARQRTLRALIDWSAELCTAPERLLWSRLTVFPGRFDLEAAEEVCGFGALERGEVMDLLDRLVAQSLLQADRSADRVRFLQLVTVREYGLELLGDDDGRGDLQRRHRDCFLRRAELMIREWSGPHQAEHMRRTREDHHNLMAALEWSLRTPGERGCADRLGSALRYHWVAGGHLSDGRQWLERILDGQDPPTAERATALWAAGWLCLLQGDHEAGRGHLERAGAVAEHLGDPLVSAAVQQWSALHLMFVGRLEESIGLYLRAQRTEESAGETSLRLTALFQLGLAQVLAGQAEAAGCTSHRVLELSAGCGERWNRAYGLWIGALSLWSRDRCEDARPLAEEALRIQGSFHDGVCTAHCIELLSWIECSTGDARRALELHDVAEALWRGLGTTLRAFGPHLSRLSTESAAAARRELGHAGPSTAPAESAESAASLVPAAAPSTARRLTQQAAIELALREGGAGSGLSPGGSARRRDRGGDAADAARSAGRRTSTGGGTSSMSLAPLTPKESQTAVLVAEGLTNRAIAQRLVVSPRTIDGHMENILAKLGFSSRAQVAAWVERRRAAAGQADGPVRG